jgi:hypothetical protein
VLTSKELVDLCTIQILLGYVAAFTPFVVAIYATLIAIVITCGC